MAGQPAVVWDGYAAEHERARGGGRREGMHIVAGADAKWCVCVRHMLRLMGWYAASVGWHKPAGGCNRSWKAWRPRSPAKPDWRERVSDRPASLGQTPSCRGSSTTSHAGGG